MRTEMEAIELAQELGAEQDGPIFVPWREDGKVGIRFTWRGVDMVSPTHHSEEGENFWCSWAEQLEIVAKAIDRLEETGHATDVDGNAIYPEAVSE